MITRQFKVTNPSGLHARPATDFSKIAQSFKSSVEITFKGKTKNAKSTISIMALGIKQGSTIDVAFSGEDEQQACEAIEALVAANFNE
ncbi:MULTISPECIES: HPr family phosphocarrier protein [Anaerotruncus]|jgi:phosphocarrier protein HPr|uniref:HPr family phosphocarrier protein n=1 Tax=Anaerotruncus TaxID=244127 RepID=UPI0008346B46|nr:MULTISPECIES: HPr family phosphocarrier protein [Anaerotruncus]RGX55909.1 HPr family phosphocarrier protein [Anaerotruncus sp. AF02-27]